MKPPIAAASSKLEGNLRDRPHERPIFQGFCVSPRRQRSWHHCQQLGDLLRVAGGVGSDATAEAVDGRAKAVQLDVVDNEKSVVEVVGVGDGESTDIIPKFQPSLGCS